MTGDEYMNLLNQRRDQWIAEHPAPTEGAIRPKSWVLPLPEHFIRPGDEDMVELPEPKKSAPKPKPAPRPRRVVDVADLIKQRDALVARRDRIVGTGPADRAAANLSPNSRNKAAARAGRRRFDAMDRDLERFANLTRRINTLNSRIAARGGDR